MDFTFWYAISIVALVATVFILKIMSRVIASVGGRTRLYLHRDIWLPLLISSRYQSRATRAQALFIVLYTVINAFGMGCGIHTSNDLMIRTGTMASINLIPLLLGGRTNLVAEFLGSSLHTYYLAHHWLGRLAVLQSMLHVGLVLTKGEPWTFHTSQIPGISSSSALALLLVLSLYFVRRAAYEIFLKVHFLLALGAIIALFNHLLPKGVARFIYPLIALGVWVLNGTVRIARMIYHTSCINYGNVIEVIPYKKHKEGTVSVICLNIPLRRPLNARGGQYFYIFFSDLGLRRKFQAHPYMVSWWDDTKMSFLVQPQNGLSLDLLTRTSLRSIVLDGPYGKDLGLENYSKSLLLAKGIGIAGLLPYALSITKRKSTNTEGMLTTKVDLYWILEENCQLEWIRSWIEELKGIDPHRITLRLFCYSPKASEASTSLAVDAKEKWYAYFYGKMPNIPNIIKKMNENHECSIIAVCGDAKFTTAVRMIQREMMRETSRVTFQEVEFQPQHNKFDEWDQNWMDVFHRQMPGKLVGEASRLTTWRDSSKRPRENLKAIEEEDMATDFTGKK